MDKEELEEMIEEESPTGFVYTCFDDDENEVCKFFFEEDAVDYCDENGGTYETMEVWG